MDYVSQGLNAAQADDLALLLAVCILLVVVVLLAPEDD